MTKNQTKSGLTIVALSTPRGFSGIGVIRLSGPESFGILSKVFTPSFSSQIKPFPDRKAVKGRVFDPDTGKTLDDGIVLFMKGPNTYTGEDTVELSLHGSPVVLDMVIRLLVRQGARPAGPGEFTRRAFLAGKLDLLQVEAVLELIEANSPWAADEARAVLDKSVSKPIMAVSESLKDLLAELEWHIDFDEDDEAPLPDVMTALQTIVTEMNALKENSARGRLRREGLSTVIVGKTNVGKSTLFNSLLREERTIVTQFPGTTRDPVDERLVLGGMAYVLCDTAGIRDSPEPIEEEGIRRSIARMEEADLVIFVIDASLQMEENDFRIAETLSPDKMLIALNKIDLGTVVGSSTLVNRYSPFACVPISAKTGQGLDDLLRKMTEFGEQKTRAYSTFEKGSLNRRAVLLLEAASRPLEAALHTLKTGDAYLSLDILALEMRRALGCLGEITGEDVDEEVLERIFEGFCVGK